MATTMDEFADDLQKNVVGNIVKIATVNTSRSSPGRFELTRSVHPRLLVESFDHLHKETIKLTDAAGRRSLHTW